MKLHINKYKTDDGYVKDGVNYGHDESRDESAIRFIQSGIVGFCVCGRPTDSLAFIRDGLALIDKHRAEVAAEGTRPWARSDWKSLTVRQESEQLELCPNAGAWAMFLYLADAKGWTEHGGGVGCSWLSPEGEELLHDLRELTARGVL